MRTELAKHWMTGGESNAELVASNAGFSAEVVDDWEGSEIPTSHKVSHKSSFFDTRKSSYFSFGD